jgi:endonuclease YncB( thermonuclease family)
MLRLFIAALAACALLAGHAFAQEACQLTPIGSATVAAVRDGRTLSLADGRQLRLAAIEVTDQSRAALQRLIAGKSLRLERLGSDLDRYGRLVAFAFAGESGPSLQQELLAKGAARVSGRVGSRPCAEALLTSERAARAGRRGLWAYRRFSPIKAENLARLQANRGHFALVEGKVLSLHRSGGTLYLNFGRRWTKDFSVIILRRRRPIFAAAGVDPRRLEGRRIRVRGFIEMRRGPVIEAEVPEQIEFADSADGARVSDKDRQP